MPLTSTPSVLQQIQPTIFRFTKMLASVLQLEVEIVDATMVRISGTGPYAKLIGKKLNGSSRLLSHVLQEKEEKIIVQSRLDPLCEGCADKGVCKEKAFIGVPIIVQNACVGVISLVAISPEQQLRIKENAHDISEYVSYISSIFVSKIIGAQSADELGELFTSLIENMDQGVLVLDENEQVRSANAVALKQLNCTQEKILGRVVSVLPRTCQQDSSSDHLQHIVTFADRREIIIGQLHNGKNHQLFLMSFHQPHPAIPEGQGASDPRIRHIIGESKPMRVLKSLVTRVATSPSSVLIVSESGTGKEVVARAIHEMSGRNHQPFVAINCAAIPEALQESELFGYLKGAFTGASTSGKVGLIQSANGGTLFLDEIGDMSLGMQAKLLRAIENREVQPIGASKPIAVDIRIIAATHQPLERLISEGKFREDLFYRINVIPLSIPPLRERQGDIELLAHHFINLHAKRIGVVYPGISPDVIKLLPQYHWPGNLRELSNLMEYLVNVVPNGEVIDESLLPPNITNGLRPRPSTGSGTVIESIRVCDENASITVIENMERQMIEEALLRHKNKKMAADELGIGIATLYRKINKYGVKPA
jgi:transcriptional regulator with PAS, ATPase and Fis domain